ncbi:MAG: hypothetical protein EOP84_11030 [Verrucomicrobiaceae bacterium]|nr:MAG: hypothetical protein EOP84_11030 [Verrucomicrobiaceae bacterium]
MSEILYWTRNFPTHCFVGDPRGEQILKSVAFQPVTTSEKPQWWDVSMPDFEHLTWDDVIELRSSPYLQAFREVYAELSMSGRSSDLRQRYHDALGALADEVKPDVRGVTITQILANIPGMFLNPVAIASGADSIGKEMHREAQYGWVFFVRAVDKAKKAGLTPTAKQ